MEITATRHVMLPDESIADLNTHPILELHLSKAIHYESYKALWIKHGRELYRSTSGRLDTCRRDTRNIRVRWFSTPMTTTTTASATATEILRYSNSTTPEATNFFIIACSILGGQ